MFGFVFDESTQEGSTFLGGRPRNLDRGANVLHLIGAAIV